MSDTFRILIPLDGSELSERVFPYARLLKSTMPDSEVELLRCFEPPASIYLIPELAVPATSMFGEGELGSAIKDYLKRKAEELELEETTVWVAISDPATEILSRSEEFNLILMASHGRGGLGRWLMGSVANKVTRGTTVPTMVVSAKAMEIAATQAPNFDTILVAYDGSPAAERAVFKAASLARAFNATLHLYQGVVQVAMPHHVVVEANLADLENTSEALAQLAARLDGVKTHVEVREVGVSTGIVEYAQEINAGLVVIGSHGKSGLARWMIGSETEHVLHEAHSPVLVTH